MRCSPHPLAERLGLHAASAFAPYPLFGIALPSLSASRLCSELRSTSCRASPGAYFPGFRLASVRCPLQPLAYGFHLSPLSACLPIRRRSLIGRMPSGCFSHAPQSADVLFGGVALVPRFRRLGVAFTPSRRPLKAALVLYLSYNCHSFHGTYRRGQLRSSALSCPRSMYHVRLIDGGMSPSRTSLHFHVRYAMQHSHGIMISVSSISHSQ